MPRLKVKACFLPLHFLDASYCLDRADLIAFAQRLLGGSEV
jgi:hypothetical protein